MNCFRNWLIGILIVVGLQTALTAQNHPMLSSFNVNGSGGQAYLSWTIISGSTCNGIQIYHSTDSLTFTLIGEIYGVCGSVSEPQHYNFTDTDPEINSVNYYRLELGGQGVSQVISLKLTALVDGYNVMPNPSNTESRIYFENGGGDRYQLSVFNVQGMRMAEAETDNNYFQLNTAKWAEGVYVFTISGTSNGKTLHGKMVVRH